MDLLFTADLNSVSLSESKSFPEITSSLFISHPISLTTANIDSVESPDRILKLIPLSLKSSIASKTSLLIVSEIDTMHTGSILIAFESFRMLSIESMF